MSENCLSETSPTLRTSRDPMSSYVLANYDSTPTPTVLLLRGWSPGPTTYLKTKLTELDCDVVEIDLLMPPWFLTSTGGLGLWCLDLNFMLMCIVVIFLLWALYKILFQFESFEKAENPLRPVFFALLVAVLGYWIRLMVAVVGRSAIANGVDKCTQQIRSKNVVLCVGFSWGAGVLAELLTIDHYKESEPAYLLMAPVSHATAVATMRTDAAFRLQPLDGHSQVCVVHANNDPYFCPHPERWENLDGIKAFTLQDIHVFKNASSRRQLSEIMISLFLTKTERV